MKKTSVDIFIPVLNEEKILLRNVKRLEQFLKKQIDWNWKIIIVDNGSTDQTHSIASKLSQKNKNIQLMHLAKKGKGGAIQLGWMRSKAQVRCYLDVDLSTSFKALPQLVNAIHKKSYDIAIGSRLIPGAKVEGRSFLREFFSRAYNLLAQTTFPGLGIKDLQCGCKAVSPRIAEFLLPQIKNKRFFFDTELLLLARFWGATIAEIPVDWKDEPDSRVNIVSVIKEDILGLLRLRFLAMPKKPKTW